MSDYRSADISTLQKEFVRTSTALSRRYVALHDQAPDAYEEQCWLDRIIELRTQKRGVEYTDRGALIRCIDQWATRLNDLDVMERGYQA
ncbi:hypothetical protein [Nocardiopsis synnemataformans]|uniref:hypothetical protein n=1 Tax=Nocardiopsis synnemataformans TaxID=61305 RepID=UPI003EBA96B6